MTLPDGSVLALRSAVLGLVLLNSGCTYVTVNEPRIEVQINVAHSYYPPYQPLDDLAEPWSREDQPPVLRETTQ